MVASRVLVVATDRTEYVKLSNVPVMELLEALVGMLAVSIDSEVARGGTVLGRDNSPSPSMVCPAVVADDSGSWVLSSTLSLSQEEVATFELIGWCVGVLRVSNDKRSRDDPDMVWAGKSVVGTEITSFALRSVSIGTSCDGSDPKRLQT